MIKTTLTGKNNFKALLTIDKKESYCKLDLIYKDGKVCSISSEDKCFVDSLDFSFNYESSLKLTDKVRNHFCI